MKGKLVFVAGAALGYVLGARAGRKRYEQIRAGAEKFWNSPTVQKGVDQVQSFVDDHGPEVQAAVTGSAKKVVDQVTKRGGSRGSQQGNGGSSGSGSTGSVGGTPTAASEPPAAGSLPDAE